MPSVDPDSLFTDEQRTRARALDAARAVLVQRGAFNSGQVSNVVDLIIVAQWIIDGNDPWPLNDDESDVFIIRDKHGNVVQEIRNEAPTDAELSGEPADEGIQANR